MLYIIGAIIAISIIAGLFTLISSTNPDPTERIKEAGSSVVDGALTSTGCVLGLILEVLPFILGMLLLSLIFRGC